MALFVLTMINGPEYDRSRPRRKQRGWDEHAAADAAATPRAAASASRD